MYYIDIVLMLADNELPTGTNLNKNWRPFCSLPQMSYRSCHQIVLAQKLTQSYPLMDLVQIQIFFVTLGLDTKAIVVDT